MKIKLKVPALGLAFTFLLFLTFTPMTSTTSIVQPSGAPHQFLTHSSPSKDATYIAEIPYVWQEINGFCFWSCLSMALQHIGLPLNLYDVFAVTGIGFSAVHIKNENLLMLVPGSNYRQLYHIKYLKTFLGIEFIVMIDKTTESGQILSLTMDSWNLDYQTFEGGTEAQVLLCQSIDAGYPLLLWVDPYYLPVHDYNILRELNLHSSDTGSGHAILAIGYNDTTQEVWIMDPGIGAFGENVAYPSDGRWHYSISYSNLTLARQYLGFTAIQLTPSSHLQTPPSNAYPAFILQRLLGLPASYEIRETGPLIVGCGARAFQQLSSDLSPKNLANYLFGLKLNNLIITQLFELGIILEQMLTLQHLSYRSALTRLPALLPEYDLSSMRHHGQSALLHFEALSTNSSLTAFDPSSYNSLIKDTFWGIAASFEQTGNIYEAVDQYAENLSIIQFHLNGIAGAWNAAGLELNSLIHAPTITSFFIMILGEFIIALIIVPIAIVLHNKRKAQNQGNPQFKKNLHLE